MNLDMSILTTKTTTGIIKLFRDVMLLIPEEKMASHQDLIFEYEEMIDQHQEALHKSIGYKTSSYQQDINRCLNFKPKDVN